MGSIALKIFYADFKEGGHGEKNLYQFFKSLIKIDIPSNIGGFSVPDTFHLPQNIMETEICAMKKQASKSLFLKNIETEQAFFGSLYLPMSFTIKSGSPRKVKNTDPALNNQSIPNIVKKIHCTSHGIINMQNS